MKTWQERVGKFVDERKWGEIYHSYDVLLNIMEELSEIYNVIKHLERDEERLQVIIEKSRDELEDDIGDLTYLSLKLAHIFGIDAERALERALTEFEERFPVEKLKGHHGNLRAGGVDYKYQAKEVKS